MMYPSWGIRPGQIDAAVADQLAGKTSAEVNGELPRGFDFARFIHGITDPDVIVYCTWWMLTRATISASILPTGNRCITCPRSLGKIPCT